jgi:hypothetical protein
MIGYDDLIKNKNIFIKSDIGSFMKQRIDLECVKSDFDKIIILDRKDKEKQIESFIHAERNSSFLESNKYWLDNIDNYTEEDVDIKSGGGITVLKQSIPELTDKLNSKCYYYEDLFLGNFSELFTYLEIEYNEEYFKMYLDKKNKYRLDNIEPKESKTLI